MDMICRISDMNDGDDGYYGLDEYGHPVHCDYIDPMGDYFPPEDDDRREWEMKIILDEHQIARMEKAQQIPDYLDMINAQVQILKKMYGNK